MFKRLRMWWERRRALKRFGCALWCPNCQEELHFHSSRIEREGNDVPLEVVRYYCTCGIPSRWYFGAPVPLLLNGPKPPSREVS